MSSDKPSKTDKFGLPPVGRGKVRGVLRNIRQTKIEAAFGEMTIIDFDLWRGHDEPAIPVQMRGNDFSQPVYEGWVGDVEDPDPSVRPLLTRRVRFPHADGHDLISYTPGEDRPNPKREAIFAMVVVVAPLAFIAIVLAWVARRFGWL